VPKVRPIAEKTKCRQAREAADGIFGKPVRPASGSPGNGGMIRR